MKGSEDSPPEADSTTTDKKSTGNWDTYVVVDSVKEGRLTVTGFCQTVKP